MLIILPLEILAQAVTLDPESPSTTQEVTITFDVTQATDSRAQDLLGLTSNVFLWSGAGSGSDAFEFEPPGQTNFNAPFEPGRMTFLGENIWEIKMVIQDYYDVPPGVKIIKLGLLLKNGNGSAQTEDFIVDIGVPEFDAIIIEPTSPTVSDNLKITVDLVKADDSRKEGLLGLEDGLFLWSGIGDSGNPFRYGPPGQENFSAAVPGAEMTSLGGDKWQIELQLNDFFDIEFGAEISRMGFLVKNEEGSAQTEDFIIKVFPGGDFLSFISPQSFDRDQFVEIGTNFPIEFGASSPGALEIQLDTGDGFKTVVTGSDTDRLLFDYPVTKEHTLGIKIQAILGGDTLAKIRQIDFRVVSKTQNEVLPPGVGPGINYAEDDTKLTLALVAPDKDFVFVVGDFTNWQLRDEFQMRYDSTANTFWLPIQDLIPGKEYIFQYWVDGNIKVGDPYADKVANPFTDGSIPTSVYPDLIEYPDVPGNGVATTFQTGQQSFEWGPNEDSWIKPEKQDLVIYELFMGDFLGSHDFKDMVDTLSYLKRLGINAIELMPIAEHEADCCWGYDPYYMFAPEKFYGTKNDLKSFIQAAHQLGIAVIQDIVLNHHTGLSPLVQMFAGANPFEPSADNPWFNQEARHPFNVFSDMNHESVFTQAYVDSVVQYWISEYHFDGFRFDLSKGFTQQFSSDDSQFRQHDQGRIDILTRIANQVWEVDPTGYVILEHFAEESEETELASLGMLLWSNFNFSFKDLLSGNNVSQSLVGLERLTHVTYMESHDEERLVYHTRENGRRVGEYDIADLSTGLERSKLGAAFFFTLPGPKMLLQFQELGYDQFLPADNPGRTDPKPTVWGDGNLGYYADSSRLKVYNTYAAIINLTHEYAEVFESQVAQFSLTESTKSIQYEHDLLDVLIIGNFDLNSQEIVPDYPEIGIWYDFFTGDSINVFRVDDTYQLNPGEFHILTTVRLKAPGDKLVPWTVEFREVTGIKEERIWEQLVLFPNPAQDHIMISGMDSHRFGSLKIFSLLGESMPLTYDVTNYNSLSISLDGFPPGLYFLILSDKNGLGQAEKFLISK